MLESSVPPRFWVEALSTTVYLINRLPSPTLHFDSPYSRLFGVPPDYNCLHVFGCVCFVHLPPIERDKLTAQAVQCAFLGYSNSHKGTPTRFRPGIVYQRRRPLPLPSSEPLHDSIMHEPHSSEPPSDHVVHEPHRSTRVSRPPDWYGFSTSAFQATLDTTFVPKSYSQASTQECWRQAMQDELQALQDNHTWDIVPCPARPCN
ncbi:hypothetical protein EZV62_024265 [Acer yangbiense]|uniref:Retroviral polymerase SH3-like domain-containing protein n=1 Tax=Acer yangbiense TaxID=1000413 RepID=A0A5C7H481_9ROSI|nr:hypothetical protein EZV62_024265 [Acer yangbiense]